MINRKQKKELVELTIIISLYKRSLIKTVKGQLYNISPIEHSRNRSVQNYLS
ncbi:MAG: transposase [cyanobacterium endosymbiont of Epithemia adnata isolate EadnSB Bon19]